MSGVMSDDKHEQASAARGQADAELADAGLAGAVPPTATAAIERALLVDMARTEVLLVRHGQQDRTVAQTRPGQTDPPLTDKGRRQAARAAAYLAGTGIARIYCSDLSRARETAQIVAAQVRTGEEPTVVPDLREVRLFRDLPQDRPLLEVLGRDGILAAAEAFRRSRRFDAFPDSESSAQLRARAVVALTALVEAHGNERIAVVAHGGLINSLLAEILGIEQDMFFFPAHASVTRVLHAEGRWALGSANETAHLSAGEQLVTF